MTMKRALQVILAVALGGAAFSGFLTWREFAQAAGPGCGPVSPGSLILGYPPCVYGLAMYLTVVAVASLGLRAGR